MKIPSALGMGAIGLLDKNSAISKQFGLGGDDAAAKAAEEEKKKKTDAAAAVTPTGITAPPAGMKRGGKVKKMAKGGSASSRADGCASRGRTKGRFV